MAKQNIYVAQFHVSPEKGNESVFKGCPFAYVNIYGMAESEKSFCQLVSAELASNGIAIISMENIMLLEENGYVTDFEPTNESNEVLKLISEKYPIQFGEFNAYTNK